MPNPDRAQLRDNNLVAPKNDAADVMIPNRAAAMAARYGVGNM